MSVVATLLGIVAPVFLIVAAGYGAVRAGFFTDGLVDGLTRYAVAFAVPCLLFRAMLGIDLAEAVSIRNLIAFFGAGTACFLGAMAVSRVFWRRRPGESVAVGFCAFFPNVVMLGIPISERAFGPTAVSAVFGVIAFHSIYNYFLGFIAMEMVRRDRAGLLTALSRAFVTTFRNPLMIGLVSGMAVNLLGISLPGVVADALAMVVASALPVALFSLGGVLTRYSLRAEASEALLVSCFSLIVHPALAWVIASQIFALPLPFVQAAVILAAMPPGINGFIFASLYGRAVGTAASAALIGTVLSVGTISVWLVVLGA